MVRPSREALASVTAAVWSLSFLRYCALALHEEDVACPAAIFSFGTSMSDTGNQGFAFPGQSFADLPPYGSSYFCQPHQRFSDGRLILDFLASSLDFPFIEPFLTDRAPDYTRGVNFAFSGALALPQGVPYYFDVQTNQFVTFRARALSSGGSPSHFPTLEAFDEGLYVVFFGRNDFTHAYRFQNLTPAEVLETVVPELVQVIVDGIQKLYEHGARNFLVFNVNPQGCQPQYMTLFGALDAERDENGCLATYNRVVEEFNSFLWQAVRTLRMVLKGSVIFYADFYGIAKEVFDNPKQYGFAPDKTLVSCCGTGGQYNFDPVERCGYHGMVSGSWVDVSKACDKPSEHISWDGIHFTEAFYRHVALRLMTGQFLDPPVDMSKTCNLDFAAFSESHCDRAWE